MTHSPMHLFIRILHLLIARQEKNKIPQNKMPNIPTKKYMQKIIKKKTKQATTTSFMNNKTMRIKKLYKKHVQTSNSSVGKGWRYQVG